MLQIISSIFFLFLLRPARLDSRRYVILTLQTERERKGYKAVFLTSEVVLSCVCYSESMEAWSDVRSLFYFHLGLQSKLMVLPFLSHADIPSLHRQDPCSTLHSHVLLLNMYILFATHRHSHTTPFFVPVIKFLLIS